jgi:CBS domain containing-hemolysin-like protein
MISLSLILFALGLVILNGFFVAAEFAIVKLRHTRVQAIKNVAGVRGRILAKIHNHMDAYLSACQLGITLASLGLGWVGEPAFARLVEPLLLLFNIDSPKVLHGVSLAVAFTFVSFLHIVLGELAPKSLAIRRPEAISLWTAIPLYSFYWLMYPAIWFLNKSANLILRLFGLSKHHEHEGSYSPAELKMILSTSHLHGQLAQQEKETLEHILDLATLTVADVMRPSDEMLALNVNAPLQENIDKITQYHFSRYPIYENDPNNLIGLVHVKVLFAALNKDKELHDLKSFLRPILEVDRDMPATDLFEEFRKGFSHFAIVKNDTGSLIGFVTLDNILGTLFGHIQDEFHKTQEDWVQMHDGSLLMKGNLPVYTLEKAIGVDIADAEEIDTITGLIMARLERLPQLNERISFDAFDIVVSKMRGPKVLFVQVYPKIP